MDIKKMHLYGASSVTLQLKNNPYRNRPFKDHWLNLEISPYWEDKGIRGQQEHCRSQQGEGRKEPIYRPSSHLPYWHNSALPFSVIDLAKVKSAEKGKWFVLGRGLVKLPSSLEKRGSQDWYANERILPLTPGRFQRFQSSLMGLFMSGVFLWLWMTAKSSPPFIAAHRQLSENIKVCDKSLVFRYISTIPNISRSYKSIQGHNLS